MEINDLVDKHLTPAEDGEKYYVVTLTKKKGKYTARENVNVNLIRCIVNDFKGSKGYSNISQSDINCRDSLIESEFYIYNSVVSFNETTFTSCYGEFYNCYISGKLIIQGGKITFKRCYLNNAFIYIKNGGEVLIEGDHKRKSKVGYNDTEIPDTEIQIEGGLIDNEDGYIKTFKVESSKLIVNRIKKVEAKDSFIFNKGGDVFLSTLGYIEASGKDDKCAILYNEGGCVIGKSLSGLADKVNGSGIICKGGVNLDLDGVGEIISKTGKACELRDSTIRLRNIGGLYAIEGSLSLGLFNCNFDISGLGTASYTKVITIENSNGKIEHIGTIDTNAEAFKITSGSDVKVKKIEKIKVGQDFILIENSKLSIQGIETFTQPLPMNFLNSANSNVDIIDFGSVQPVSLNFIKASNSTIKIENGNISAVNEYLISSEISFITLNKATGTVNQGITDNLSKIWIIDSTLSVQGSPVLNLTQSEVKLKNTTLNGSSGNVSVVSGKLLELTNNSDLKFASGNLQELDLHIWKSTMEATGSLTMSSGKEIILEEKSIFKSSSGDISITGADVYIRDNSSLEGQNVSISGGNVLKSISSMIKASSGNLIISNSFCEVIKNTLQATLVKYDSNQIVSFKNTYSGNFELSSSQYKATFDSISGNTTATSSGLECFKVSGVTLTLTSSSGKFNNCSFSSVVVSSASIEGIGTSFGNITGSGLTGAFIGGSATISANGEYLLVGANNSTSSSNCKVVSIGKEIPTEAKGIGIEDTVSVRKNADMYIKLDSGILKVYESESGNMYIVMTGGDNVKISKDGSIYVKVGPSQIDLVAP